jgi:hypothetical protein
MFDWGRILVSRNSSDPAHWHSRAEEARIIADTLKIQDAKRIMYEIAGDFKFRAAQAERQLADKNTGKSH